MSQAIKNSKVKHCLSSSSKSSRSRFRRKQQRDSPLSHDNTDDKHHKNPRTRERSYKFNEKKLTISRPNRQKPIPYLKSQFRPEKGTPRPQLNISCAFCNKSIVDFTSITEAPGGKGFAHFDCVIKSLKGNESVEYPQRLSYLGSGNFAIIEPVSHDNKENLSFRIIRYVYTKPQQNNDDVLPFIKADIAITPRYVLHVDSIISQIKQRACVRPLRSESIDIQDFRLLEDDN